MSLINTHYEDVVSIINILYDYDDVYKTFVFKHSPEIKEHIS